MAHTPQSTLRHCAHAGKNRCLYELSLRAVSTSCLHELSLQPTPLQSGLNCRTMRPHTHLRAQQSIAARCVYLLRSLRRLQYSAQFIDGVHTGRGRHTHTQVQPRGVREKNKTRNHAHYSAVRPGRPTATAAAAQPTSAEEGRRLCSSVAEFRTRRVAVGDYEHMTSSIDPMSCQTLRSVPLAFATRPSLACQWASDDLRETHPQ